MTRILEGVGGCLLSAAAILSATPALAVQLTIVNPSFEDKVLACSPGFGCFIDGDIPGWSVSTIPQTATFKPSTTAGGTFPGGIPNGVNVAAVGNQTGTGAIWQTLSTTLQPNTAYSLSAAVGRRADFPYSGYSMELNVGQNVLMSSSSANPAIGHFSIDSFTFSTSTNTIGLGQPIIIRLRSLVSGAQVDFDSITLNAVPVPEPSTSLIMLLGLGFIGAATSMRKLKAPQ